MMRLHRRSIVRLASAACVVALAVPSASCRAVPQQVPERLDDSTFWRISSESSEPGGYFRSDNFVGNEGALQYVIPPLEQTIKPGGAYVGVGPDQNFTYVVAFRPRIAFIVDIRRQNLLQHLMYKALIESAADRADFLSRLFARPRPPGLDSATSVDSLMRAFAVVPGDSALHRKTFDAVREALVTRHGFTLSNEDLQSLRYVSDAFFEAGPDITYNFGTGRGYYRGYGGFGMPTFSSLVVENDGQGAQRGYLASEANFRVLKDLEVRNLIVPVVGDFGGDKALRAVGTWLRSHGASVNVFYLSNVEQYLFQEGDAWRRFYTNVGTMPVAANGTFIRSVSNRQWARMQNPRSRSAQVTCSIEGLLREFTAGRIMSYGDVIALSR